MKAQRTQGLKLVLLGLALVGLGACGALERRGLDAARNVPLESFGPEEIFQRAEFDLERGDASEAADLFAEIERLYPYSQWARRALIMQAFAYHEARDYENSRLTAQRFIDLYPADEEAAYAQYLLALSYYDQIDDVGRDQGITFQALQSLRTVIEEYPSSEYASDAILKFDLAFDHLAGKEMEIGRYYLRRDHFPSAINRFRVVVEEFQTTTHTAEALHRLVEAYLSLGLTQEAQTAGAILAFNFQSTDWYEDTFNLLERNGLRAQAEGDSWLAAIYRQTIQGRWL